MKFQIFIAHNVAFLKELQLPYIDIQCVLGKFVGERKISIYLMLVFLHYLFSLPPMIFRKIAVLKQNYSFFFLQLLLYSIVD
jgi:hypothetical protein